MKQKLKTNKGITLIALIITIIILLILATVSIKLLVDQGIVGRSKSATSKYKVAEEKEKINLAYADYKMEKAENGTATLTVEGATVSGDETSGWTITFAKTGNRYKFVPSQGQPELKPQTEDESFLEKYMLGEDKKGIDLFTILNPEDFTFSDSNVKFLNALPGANERIMCLYATYNGKVYKLVGEDLSADVGLGLPTITTKSVELVYEPTGREGQTIPYSYDGTKENEKDWTVLYDYGNGVVEIVSPDTMGSLTLGWNDEEAQTPGDIDKNGKANEHLDKTIYSYNNAISRINKYAESQVTNTNKISVRSVGSNPNNPSAESGMYKSEKLSQWLDGKYNGLGKGTDTNHEQDIIRLSYYGKIATGNYYWLASREVREASNSTDFIVKYVYSDGNLSGCTYLWSFNFEYSGYASDQSGYYAIRPVVKINSPV